MIIPRSLILQALATETLFHLNVTDCDSSQLTAVSRSATDAINCLDTVLNIHSGRISSEFEPELRQRYFGDISDDEFATVTKTFQSEQANWEKVGFSCPLSENSCDPGVKGESVTVFAVTRTTNKVINGTLVPTGKEIFLCPAFFQSIDHAERINTLIHEMSHAIANKTTDVSIGGRTPYGEAAAQENAIWSTTIALRNADNYSLYARSVCIAASTDEIPPAQDIDQSEPDHLLTADITRAEVYSSREYQELSALAGIVANQGKSCS